MAATSGLHDNQIHSWQAEKLALNKSYVWRKVRLCQSLSSFGHVPLRHAGFGKGIARERHWRSLIAVAAMRWAAPATARSKRLHHSAQFMEALAVRPLSDIDFQGLFNDSWTEFTAERGLSAKKSKKWR